METESNDNLPYLDFTRGSTLHRYLLIANSTARLQLGAIEQNSLQIWQRPVAKLNHHSSIGKSPSITRYSVYFF